MGITNQASGLKPGVCTSTTRPSTPYEGMMIFETDTNRVLIWDNAAWVMIADTDTPPGLVFIKSQTIGSAVSSVEVTNAFSSEFDHYLITCTSSMTETNLNLKLGTQNTAYYGNLIYASWNSTTISSAANNNAGFWNWVGGGQNGTAHIEILNPYLSTYTEIRTRVRYDTVYGTYIGHLGVTTSFTSFTLFPQTGTMTGGTIRVYGYRNSI